MSSNELDINIISSRELAVKISTALLQAGFILPEEKDWVTEDSFKVIDRIFSEEAEQASPHNDFLVRELPAMSEKEYFDEINRE